MISNRVSKHVCSLTEQRAQEAEERALAAEAAVVEAMKKVRAAERSRSIRNDESTSTSNWTSSSLTREPCTALLTSTAVTESVSGGTTAPTDGAAREKTQRRSAKSRRKKK